MMVQITLQEDTDGDGEYENESTVDLESGRYVY